MIKPSASLYRAIIDTLDDSMALLDEQGQIVFVNRSWVHFCRQNAGSCADVDLHSNYLAVCDAAARQGDEDGRKAAEGLRTLMAGHSKHFEMEYPCHSRKTERWFILSARPLQGVFPRLFLVAHKNITSRKRAENEVKIQSMTDGLTGLANRRRLDPHLDKLWQSHLHRGHTMGMILVDVDHFKAYNDHYGHGAGDDCLRQIAKAIARVTPKSDNLCARVGGEEFLIVLSNTDKCAAFQLANQILDAIRALQIPHIASPTDPIVTASLGVAIGRPRPGHKPSELIKEADQAMYRAKQSGRNRIGRSGMQDLAQKRLA